MRRALRGAGLGIVGLLLLAALWGALARIGWRLPTGSGEVIGHHGVLTTLGALGALIALERAVASGWWWAFAAPFAAALGALALLAGAPVGLGRGLLLAGGVVLALVLVRLAASQPSPHGAVLALGGALWVGAVLVWWGTGSVVRAVPWLAGFLVVTIAAERLELSRLRGLGGRARAGFVAALLVLLLGLGVSLASFGAGLRVVGASLLGLALWLAANDVARRTVSTGGLTRFMALALLAGYGWLGVAGALWLAAGERVGLVRDAMLHALFLGFVMSMVFAHAPVILPAVLGLEVAWAPSAYAPLALLHASLVARVVGDLAGVPGALRWTGLANVAAILLFLLDTARTRLRSRRRSHV